MISDDLGGPKYNHMCPYKREGLGELTQHISGYPRTHKYTHAQTVYLVKMEPRFEAAALEHGQMQP
jgi:hypothetical protein